MSKENNEKKIKKFKFKNDTYTRCRGKPVMLEIKCYACSKYIMSYQKDGPGKLLRCYLDRIHHPENLKNRQFEEFNTKTFPKLECENCKKMIGFPIIYAKEQRPAYHLVVNSFIMNKIY